MCFVHGGSRSSEWAAGSGDVLSGLVSIPRASQLLDAPLEADPDGEMIRSFPVECSEKMKLFFSNLLNR